MGSCIIELIRVEQKSLINSITQPTGALITHVTGIFLVQNKNGP